MNEEVRPLNPPPKLEVTFEEWWFVEFERLLASYTDWWARPNDPDPSNGEERRKALIAHARKRIGG